MIPSDKYTTNDPTILSTVDYMKTVQLGVVESIDDPQNLGRIRVRINGPANRGGDNGTATNDLPWSFPMMPKFFTSTPKVGEAVFVLIFSKQKTHSDRLYFGPIISTLENLKFDNYSTTALNAFTDSYLQPPKNVNNYKALKGIFPNPDDIAIQGRYNTDITFKKDEIVIRAGKFEVSTPTINNPYPFQFNAKTQGYIQIKNNIPVSLPKSDGTRDMGTVTNIVSNKINLLTHKDGTPRFNLTNQDDLFSNDEILKAILNAHPLAFGDILLEYLILFKKAFLNHVHNNNGLAPTDLIIGSVLNVDKFKKEAETLENIMLSKNININ
jgi:hypothetical protein